MRKIVISVGLAAVCMVLALAGTARGQGGPGHLINDQTIVPPPPPCPPGCPTATPSPTATATATATPIPLTLKVTLAHGTVAPRSKQKVTVTTLAGARVSIVVSFPNGDKKRHTGAANASGTLSWTYTQPGSRISRSSRTARVQVTASEGTLIKSSTKRYTIAFAAVDVWVQPRTLKAGKALAIWVHSTAFAVILVRLQYSGGPTVVFTAQAGADGWMYRSYTVPSASHKGRVTVKAYRQSPRGFGETSFRVT